MPAWICELCSNGCRLNATETGPGNYLLTGNNCLRGFNYAHSKLGKGVKLHAPEDLPRYPLEYYQKLGLEFGLRITKSHPGKFVQGSPERNEFRIVLEDSSGKMHLFEKNPPEKVAHKLSTAALLAKAKELAVPYVSTYYNNGGVSPSALWQALPFAEGIALDRNTYANDAWRGEKLANFILAAKQKLTGLPETIARPKTSIIPSIKNILETVQEHRPIVYARLLPVKKYLEEHLFPIHEQLPLSFCHGDPHPLNVLWTENNILTVIDWEFAGLKCELYDPALIIGCIGADDSENFTKPFIQTFYQKLKTSHLYSSLGLLPLYIIAVRFAWLSEWLRRDDTEMIENELSYMNYLTASAEGLTPPLF